MLAEKEVAYIIGMMNEEQRTFMNEYIKQSKKSEWLQVLAEKKGIVIKPEDTPEDIERMVDDWVLEEVLDSGFGNKEYQCECGRALRFQYIVRHTSKNEIYKLGETCFENYTGLSPTIIQDIKKGFHTINNERDEILIRFEEGDLSDLSEIEGEMEIPPLYEQQVNLGIPLSERQERYLQKKLNEKREHEWRERQLEVQQKLEKKLKTFGETLNKEQQVYFNDMAQQRQEELYQMMTNGKSSFDLLHLLEGLEVPEELQKQLDLNLPLFKDQVRWLYFTQDERKKRLKEGKGKSKEITYDELLYRHLDTLRAVRAKQDVIPLGLRDDWAYIQKDVKHLQKGQTIDYGIWRTKLSNLIIPLRIKGDSFL